MCLSEIKYIVAFLTQYFKYSDKINFDASANT